MHLAAKAEIVRAAIAAGWSASAEVAGDGWVADTLVTRGGVRVVFEVQWSPQTLERYRERQAAYARDGVRALWFVRKVPAAPGLRGWEASADLPVFVMDDELMVDDGLRAVGYWAALGDPPERERVPLADAVTALLGGRVAFRTRVASRSGSERLRLQLWEVGCWKCPGSSAVWTLESEPIVGACGLQVARSSVGREMWAQKDRPEAHPAVVREASRSAGEVGLVPARMQFRKTRPVPEGYMAFTCPYCSAVKGDFPLSEEIMELAATEGPRAEGVAELGSVAVAEGEPHWCWDQGEGHCPPA